LRKNFTHCGAVILTRNPHYTYFNMQQIISCFLISRVTLIYFIPTRYVMLLEW